MSNFGFPQTNYAQSQVTSNQGTFEPTYPTVENGGLFTRDECRNLARYRLFDVERSLKRMMETEMGFARPLRWPSGLWTAIEQ